MIEKGGLPPRPKKDLPQPSEGRVRVERLTLENPRTVEQLLQLDRNPRANRHLIDFDDEDETEAEDETESGDSQPQILKLVSEGSVYGIENGSLEGNSSLAAIAYFSQYEESDDPEESEDIPTLLTRGQLTETQIPRNEDGTINYAHIVDVSVFIPDSADLETLGESLRSAIDQYQQDRRGNQRTLLFFFQLRDQSQSVAAAWGAETTVPDDVYAQELAEERGIIEAAGFTYGGEIENGDIGLFTLVVPAKGGM